MATKIAFIGGGNMARALLGGLLNAGWLARDLTVSEPVEARRREIADAFGVTVYSDNAECAAGAEVVLLAVKPQMMSEAVSTLKSADGQLILSIAAGIRVADIQRWLAGEYAVVRAMPNTPALVNAGITGLFATEKVTAQQRDAAENILRAVGETVWVAREELLDVVTAVSGSGPAYFFKLMELLSQHAEHHGLDSKTADALAVHTARGAAELAQQSSASPATLREQVTSPRGTTEAALEKMNAAGFDDAVTGGVDAAIKRAGQLADENSN